MGGASMIEILIVCIIIAVLLITLYEIADTSVPIKDILSIVALPVLFIIAAALFTWRSISLVYQNILIKRIKS